MTHLNQESLGPSFVLASMLAAYPDQGFCRNVQVLLESPDFDAMTGVPAADAFSLVRVKLLEIIQSEVKLDDLRSEYIDLFDRGRQVNSLYETEYGRARAMVKGNELVDIAGFYRAFGLDTGGDEVSPEMIDHVSVELEFYALLVLKSAILKGEGDASGSEIVLDARRKFLKSHLGRFVSALSERPGVLNSPFYSLAFGFIRDLVGEECRRLEVVVEPEKWISGGSESAEVSCGGTIGCPK